MERTLILEKVKAQAATIFAMAPDQIKETDSHKEIKAWDSLGHLRLFMALEAEFGLKFDVAEMTANRTITAIAHLIGEKV